MGCLCLGGGGGDAVDKQRAEAEKLKEKDRARINREIEKGNVQYFFVGVIIVSNALYAKICLIGRFLKTLR